MSYFKNLFKGRLGRKHYFIGVLILLAYILIVVYSLPSNLPSIIQIIIFLPYFLFRVSFAVRRLNDHNHWYRWAVYLFSILVLNMIPVLGDLIWFSSKGDKNANKYGQPDNESTLRALFKPL